MPVPIQLLLVVYSNNTDFLEIKTLDFNCVADAEQAVLNIATTFNSIQILHRTIKLYCV